MATAEVLSLGGHTARTGSGARDDAALACLATLLRLRDMGADYEQLRLESGCPGAPLTERDLVGLARRRGLRAKVVRARARSLRSAVLPAIAFGQGGGAVVLAKAVDDRVLVFDPALPKPVERPLGWLERFWTGRLLVVAPGVRAAGGPAKLDFAWFLPALVRHRGLFANVLAASLFIQLFSLATPLFTMVVIDKVLTSSNLSTLDVLVVGILALAVFDAVLGLLRGHLLTHTTHRIDAELGARLFRHLTSLPLGWFSRRAVGATLARVKELEAVRGFLTGSALTVLIDLVFTIVFLAVLYAFSPALTAIVAGTVLLIGLVYWAIAPAIRRRLQDKFAATSDLDGFLVETVGGIETVKALGAEPVLQRQWEDGVAANARAAFQATSLSAATGHAAGFFNKLMAALILWYGARLVLDGQITAGTLIAFNMLAGRVSAPALRLAQLWQQCQQARVSLAKLSDILEAPVERGREGDRRPLPRLRGAVEFARVTFRYRPDEPAVLDGLSFQVPAGQVVGVTAPSGAGKTTVMKLLQRLYVPEAGRVLVDGIDVGAVEPGWLRRQIGVVPQDVHLFNRSVRDNIAFADPAMSTDAVVAAAGRAGAHEFIVKLPDAYDTVIGERGCQLSGGQRQRLALARALAQDPRLLILDEATSALDDAAERAILTDLRRLSAGRTVFVVSHRISALRRCDRVLVLEAGRVVEDGAPAGLLARNGRYAALARARVADDVADAVTEAAQ